MGYIVRKLFSCDSRCVGNRMADYTVKCHEGKNTVATSGSRKLDLALNTLPDRTTTIVPVESEWVLPRFIDENKSRGTGSDAKILLKASFG